MPYGTIKIDTITFTDGGVDKSVSVSGLTQNPTFSGNITVTGTVSGTTVRATTVSGVTVTGTTVNAASGVFTTQISGAIVKVPAGSAGAPTVQVGTGATVAPGLYGASTDQLGFSTGGSSVLVIDSVGQIRVINSGTEAAPALVVGNDINTGLYSPGADQLALSTGGTGRLFIDASGNIGINTTPSSLGTSVTTLEIKGASTARSGGLRISSSDSSVKGAFYIYDGAGVLGTETATPLDIYTNNTSKVRITSAGNVGIGTSSPLTKLDVRNGVITAGSASSTSGAEILRGYYSDVDGALAVIGTEYSSGGIVIGSSVKPSTSAAGAFLSSTSANIARGAYTIAGNIHKWYMGSAQTVAENSSVSTSEVMRLDSSGRLGIGTSTPGVKIDIVSDNNTSLASVLRVNSNNVAVNTSLAYDGLIGSGELSVRTSSTNKLYLGTNNTNALTIDSSQRVGIGTTSPNRKLEVSDASVDNFVRVNTTGASKSGIEFSNGGTVYAQLYFNNVAPYDFSLLQQYSTGSLIFGTNNTERARIDSSGRLLVGTSDGSGGVSTLVVQGASNGSPVGVAQISYNGLASGALAAGTDIGYLRFTDQGSNSGVFAQITATADATTGASDYPGRLVFSTTADGASSPTERMRISNDGAVKIAGDNFQIATSKTPASASATGTAGQVAWDASYIYVCTATNTWKRTAISTW